MIEAFMCHEGGGTDAWTCFGHSHSPQPQGDGCGAGFGDPYGRFPEVVNSAGRGDGWFGSPYGRSVAPDSEDSGSGGGDFGDTIDEMGTGIGVNFGCDHFSEGGGGSGCGDRFGFIRRSHSPPALRLDSGRVWVALRVLGEYADLPLDIHPTVVRDLGPFHTHDQIAQALAISESLETP